MKKKKSTENISQFSSDLDLKLIFDKMPNHVLILDSNQRIIAANQAALKANNEILGRLCYEVYHGTHEPPERCPCLRLINEKSPHSIDMEMGSLNGVFIISCTPLYAQDGSIEYFIHVATDLSNRKNVDKELEENRLFLRSIFNSIQDGISVLRPDLTILHVNNVMNEWYKENTPLEAKKCYEVYHNKDRPCEPCPTLRSLESGKTEMNIVPGLPGSPVEWVELYSYPMKDATTGKIYGVVEFVRDITKKVKYENAMRESEDKYRTIVSSMSDMIILHNKDDEYVEVHCKDDFPLYTPKNIFLGKKVSEVMPSKIANQYKQLAREVRESGETRVMEYSLDIKGQKMWFQGTLDLSTDKKGIVLAVTDITQRKQDELVQKALYNISRAANITIDFKELIEAIRDYLKSLIDTKNFYIALYDEAENVFNLPFFSDEKDDIATFKAGKSLTAYVLNSGESIIATEKIQKQLEKEGKVKPVGKASKVWLGVPLRYENKTVGVIAVQDYHDADKYSENDKRLLEFVSDEIALALQRQKAKQEMEQSLKEKEVLLQEIHHRVKNNMQIVWGLLDLQSEKYKDETLNLVIHECQSRIASMSLIHEMMYQTQDFKKIDMKVYIEKMVKSLVHLYQVDQDTIQIIVDSKSIFLDLNRSIPCGMIINELVSNAMKHAFPNGKKGTINIQLKKIKSVIQLKISDNGIGLPESIDVNKPGSMGLEIVNLLTGQLNGTIKLMKTKNKTDFRISFPGN